MRVVADTNILVSGLLWRGLPWHVWRLAENHQIEICIAPPLLTELERVLTYKRLQPRLRQLRLRSEDLMAYVLDRVIHHVRASSVYIRRSNCQCRP